MLLATRTREPTSRCLAALRRSAIQPMQAKPASLACIVAIEAIESRGDAILKHADGTLARHVTVEHETTSLSSHKIRRRPLASAQVRLTPHDGG
jgi:hypothetical protein